MVLDILLLLIGLIVGFVVARIINKSSDSQLLADKLEEKLNAILPKVTQLAGDQTALIAKEKLESSSQNLKDNFENTQNTIAKTVERLNQDLEKTTKRLEEAERARIGSFASLSQMLQEQKEQTQALTTTTNNLQKVLSNNQQRGIFGEQVAEELLKLNGFSRGLDYEIQQSQDTGTRPDFVVFLPNRAKINIDSKFPYQNLLHLVNAGDDKEKRSHFAKLFESDIKNKITQVTSRDYINPQENTVDFVVLFIPNEMIFSYICDKLPHIWQEAIRRKVVFAGPFSFTAILRLVKQSYDNFKIQSNLLEIVAQIKIFQTEFVKYNEELDRLGERLESAHKQFNVVTQTRTNKLLKVTDKILSSSVGSAEQQSPEAKLLE